MSQIQVIRDALSQTFEAAATLESLIKNLCTKEDFANTYHPITTAFGRLNRKAFVLEQVEKEARAAGWGGPEEGDVKLPDYVQLLREDVTALRETEKELKAERDEWQRRAKEAEKRSEDAARELKNAQWKHGQGVNTVPIPDPELKALTNVELGNALGATCDTPNQRLCALIHEASKRLCGEKKEPASWDAGYARGCKDEEERQRDRVTRAIHIIVGDFSLRFGRSVQESRDYVMEALKKEAPEPVTP